VRLQLAKTLPTDRQNGSLISTINTETVLLPFYERRLVELLCFKSDIVRFHTINAFLSSTCMSKISHEQFLKMVHAF
jgi:hypothetical protein